MKQFNGDWTYKEYRERLDAWIQKNAQRKVLRARRTERKQIKQAGGGKAVASLLLKPITRKRA
jgi:hypothetical protein